MDLLHEDEEKRMVKRKSQARKRVKLKKKGQTITSTKNQKREDPQVGKPITKRKTPQDPDNRPEPAGNQSAGQNNFFSSDSDRLM